MYFRQPSPEKDMIPRSGPRPAGRVGSIIAIESDRTLHDWVYLSFPNDLAILRTNIASPFSHWFTVRIIYIFPSSVLVLAVPEYL